MRGGAAEKAQLEEGDQLIRIDEMIVNRPEDVYSYLRSKIPSDQITIVYRRNDQEQTKTVKLGEVLSSARHVADTFDGGRSNRRDGVSTKSSAMTRLSFRTNVGGRFSTPTVVWSASIWLALAEHCVLPFRFLKSISSSMLPWENSKPYLPFVRSM